MHMKDSLSLLEKIEKENQLRFYFQEQGLFFIFYYPKIILLQNKIAEIKKRMESTSLTELIEVKEELNSTFCIDYIELYPSLFAKKFLHKIELTLKDHLIFNKELIPLYLEKVELGENIPRKMNLIKKPSSFFLKIAIGVESVLLLMFYIFEARMWIDITVSALSLSTPILAFLLGRFFYLNFKYSSHKKHVDQIKKLWRNQTICAKKIERTSRKFESLVSFMDR